MLNPVAVERAEAELSGFIERRARERSKAGELAEAWRASEGPSLRSLLGRGVIANAQVRRF